MKIAPLIVAAGLALLAAPASAAGLTVELAASAANPKIPQMGDHLTFQSVITNTDPAPQDGVIAWISLLRVDKGQEQPMDLEDWSAHKAVVEKQLAPGGVVKTDWPMRLIQAGDYRVVVSTVSRAGTALTPSHFVDFTVKQKPVVESRRVLPVALGIPALLAGVMGFGWLNRRAKRI
ncbi:MAG: hypothetical protein ACKVP7_07615 [Hyphomicrobiaceae bacterium]